MYNPIPEELRQNFGDRLEKSLKYARMTQNDMAAHLGTHRNTVNGWINGRVNPKAAAMKAWEERTGVPLTWLNTGTWPEAAPLKEVI